LIQEKVSIGTYSQFPNRLLMLSFHQSSNFFEASVIIDGLALPNVVLRKKGFIDSQSTFQLSLKIKLNHSDEKAGIEGLIQSGVHFFTVRL